jgi:hypothetical protein
MNPFLYKMLLLLAVHNAEHQHECGLADEGIREPGCGHVWTHKASDFDDLDEDAHTKGHTCPNCGKGPWYYVRRYMDERLEKATREIEQTC